MNTHFSMIKTRARQLLSRLASGRASPAPPAAIEVNQQIIEASPSAITLVDAQRPDMPIISVNSAFEQITGYGRAEVIGRNPRFLHGADRDQEGLRQLRQAIEEQKACTVTLRNYRQDGRMYWNELRLSPIFDQQGQIKQFIGIQNDITQRQLAEARREQLVENLHFLNRTALELTALPGEESIYTYIGTQLQHLLHNNAVILVNKNNADGQRMNIQGIYGLDETEMAQVTSLLGYMPIGKQYAVDVDLATSYGQGRLVRVAGGATALTHSGMPETLKSQFIQSLNLAETYLIGLQKDGAFYAGVQLHMRDQHTIASPDLIETFIQQASTALQRIQTITALRLSELRYRSLFEQSNDAVFILGMNGRHLHVNQRAAAMMGYTSEEIIGLTYRDLVVTDEHDQSDRVLERLVAGEIVPPYERTFRCKDGRLLPAEANVEIVRDNDGAPLHIQSLIRDISERKQRQQRELELALEKERLHLLSTFIEKAAHEFKTPLAIINVNAYLLLRIHDPAKRADKAQQIQQQVQRIARLIEMLLEMTALESGAPLTYSPVDIGATLALVCHEALATYNEAPIIHCETETNLPPVLGDAHHLFNALKHLLDNAYRFTPADGTISIRSGVVDKHVWLEISDTGTGIPAAYLPHVFETFWRQDKAHSTPGFGLGLTITRKIIELYHGQIFVDSKEGKGATFRILLPTAVANQATPPTPTQ